MDRGSLIAFLDLREACERIAHQGGQRFAMGDPWLKVAILQLLPDRYPGADSDPNGDNAYKQRLKIIDEAADGRQDAMARLAAGHPRLILGIGFRSE